MIIAARSVNPGALEDPSLRDRCGPGLDRNRVRPAALAPGPQQDHQGREELARGSLRQAPVVVPWPRPWRRCRWTCSDRRGCWPGAAPMRSTAASGPASTRSSATAPSAAARPRCRRTSSPTGPSSCPARPAFLTCPSIPVAPCMIGVARHTWRQEPAPEPLAMWEEMARMAAADAGCPVRPGRPSRASRSSTASRGSTTIPAPGWPNGWAPTPPTPPTPDLGGSVPVGLVSEAAAAMAGGRARPGPDRRWGGPGHPPAPARSGWSLPAGAAPGPSPSPSIGEEAANGIYQAYLTFALLDTARRAHLGRTPADHRIELGRLLAPMTEVAAAQPEHCLVPHRPERRGDHHRHSATNRMVATPYTKLMTAIMDVDMAAAVLVATEAKADALGVPADRRVYLRGAGSRRSRPPWPHDPSCGGRRPWTQAMRAALGDGVRRRGRTTSTSTPASPARSAFACDALGIEPERGLTVTGGLPYHGGPGSNYTTHALAAMAEALRADPGSLGLVCGVGHAHDQPRGAAVVDPAGTLRSRPATASGTARRRPPCPWHDEATGPRPGRHLLDGLLAGGAGVDRADLRPARRLALLRPDGATPRPTTTTLTGRGGDAVAGQARPTTARR